MDENPAALAVVEFLGTDLFSFLVFPLFAAGLGIVIKLNTRRDDIPTKVEDFAIGQELLLATFVTFLGKIAMQATNILEAREGTSSVDTERLAELGVLMLDLVLQVVIAVGLVITLIIISFVTRRIGWRPTSATGQSNYDLKVWWAIASTLIGVVALIWVVNLA